MSVETRRAFIKINQASPGGARREPVGRTAACVTRWGDVARSALIQPLVLAPTASNSPTAYTRRCLENPLQASRKG